MRSLPDNTGFRKLSGTGGCEVNVGLGFIGLPSSLAMSKQAMAQLGHTACLWSPVRPYMRGLAWAIDESRECRTPEGKLEHPVT